MEFALGSNDFLGGAQVSAADYTYLNLLRVQEFMWGQRITFTSKIAAFKARMEARPGVAAYFASCEPCLYPTIAAEQLTW